MRSSVEIIQSTAGAGGSTDLVTLDALKLELDITGITEDELNLSRIDRYSRAIAEEVGRTFALTEVVETFVFDTWEHSRQWQPLVLSHWPVVEVYSVDEGAVIDYEVNASKGLLYRTNSGWWSGRVEVSYLGGYLLPDEAPARLQEAVIQAIRDARSTSGAASDAVAAGIREVAHGDTRVGFFSSQALSSSSSTGVLSSTVLDLIKPFRRLVFA